MKIGTAGLLALLLLLPGCAVDGSTGPAGENSVAASSESTTSGPPRNAQGRIEKNFGESAGLVDNVSGEPAFTFTRA